MRRGYREGGDQNDRRDYSERSEEEAATGRVEGEGPYEWRQSKWSNRLFERVVSLISLLPPSHPPARGGGWRGPRPRRGRGHEEARRPLLAPRWGQLDVRHLQAR